ncbi:hypothetical protein Q426_08205 [Streptococcus equi subsp. zooepidemicus CY]|nr:hypothetical protein Q426_08205 [Streptococcus equi subsp. zooepidemicus CY]
MSTIRVGIAIYQFQSLVSFFFFNQNPNRLIFD